MEMKLKWASSTDAVLRKMLRCSTNTHDLEVSNSQPSSLVLFPLPPPSLALISAGVPFFFLPPSERQGRNDGTGANLRGAARAGQGELESGNMNGRPGQGGGGGARADTMLFF
jgi:hypothetical protein